MPGFYDAAREFFAGSPISSAARRRSASRSSSSRRLRFESLEERQLLTASTPTGAEFQVNTYTTSVQEFAHVASDSAGDYVAVWQSADQDGSFYGIYAQRYSAANTKIGVEFQVNSYTTLDQKTPAVAMDAAGDFVVAWVSDSQDGSFYGIYAQRYTASGVAQGEFKVNTYTTGDQLAPSISMDAVGDFVVAWESNFLGLTGPDGSGYGIYAQCYASTGSAQGSEFRVNTYTTGNQQLPSVAMDAAGDFVVAWESYGQDGSKFGIYAKQYSAAGAVTASEFRVNTYTTGSHQDPAAAMDAAGDFVIAWDSQGQDGNGYGVFAQRYASTGSALGSEFRVNSYTTSDQRAPAVAMDSAGDFVIAWQSLNQDGGGLGVYAQRYASTGSAQGSEFQVNAYTTADQSTPSVAIDARGDFVIAWQSVNQDASGLGVFARQYTISVNTYTTSGQQSAKVASDTAGDYVVVWASSGQDGSNDGVFAQRYASTGSAQGSEFQVNTYTTNRQYNPAVAMDAAGDFVIAWESRDQDGSGYGVFAQRYNAAGTVTVSEFQVNSYTTNNQRLPSVAMDAAGDFVIAWQSLNQDGSGLGIYAQRFNVSGAKQGSEFQVNTYTTSVQNAPSAAMDAAGDFVIAWQSQGQDGSGYGIYSQRYASTGLAQGSEFRVNTYTTGDQGAFNTTSTQLTGPSVAMDAAGDFVITWTSNGQDGSGYGIYAQRYASTGTAQGSEFRVNTYTTDKQTSPSVAMDTAGDFVIVWTSNGQDGSGYGIYGQSYTATGALIASEFQVNTYTTSDQQLSAVAMNAAGDFVVAWQSNGQDGSGQGVYARQYATSTVTITGTPTSNIVSVNFTDATHYTVTVNGVATSYTTFSNPNLVFNGPGAVVSGGNAVFTNFVFAALVDQFTATQTLTSTLLKSQTTDFQVQVNNAANSYFYTGGGLANVSVTLGTGSNFYVGVGANGSTPTYSYVADPLLGLYSELSGFASQTVNGSGAGTYAYFYSAPGGAFVGNPGGTSTYTTPAAVTTSMSVFPQVYMVGATDGTDSAILNSAGAGFVGTPNFSYAGGTIGGSSVLVGAIYTAHVTGQAAGANDTAFIYSYANNTFNGNPGTTSALTGNTTNVLAATVPFVVTAKTYMSLTVLESGGATDTANLTDDGTLVGLREGALFYTAGATSFNLYSGANETMLLASIVVDTFTSSGGTTTPVPGVIVVSETDGLKLDTAFVNAVPNLNNTLISSGPTVTLSFGKFVAGSLTVSNFGGLGADNTAGTAASARYRNDGTGTTAVNVGGFTTF